MEEDLLSQRNWILFEQSRSHQQCLGNGDEITKGCVTLTTLVLGLVQTDLNCTMLWRDWAIEIPFCWSKVFVLFISNHIISENEFSAIDASRNIGFISLTYKLVI